MEEKKHIRVSRTIIEDENVDAFALGVFIKISSLFNGENETDQKVASTLGVSIPELHKAYNALEKAGYLKTRKTMGGEILRVFSDVNLKNIL